MSESIRFGSSLHADSKYVISFVLGCREVPETIHFHVLYLRKKSPPAGIPIARFFLSQWRNAAKTSISAAEEKEFVKKTRRYRVLSPCAETRILLGKNVFLIYV